MDRIDLQALNLVGPTRENPVLDPLAVLDLDNRLLVSYLQRMEYYRSLLPLYRCQYRSPRHWSGPGWTRDRKTRFRFRPDFDHRPEADRGEVRPQTQRDFWSEK